MGSIPPDTWAPVILVVAGVFACLILTVPHGLRDDGPMPVLAFPIRTDPQTGGFVSVDPQSDAEVNQEIALHVLTRPGERPLRPGFGTPALPFGDGLDIGGLQLQLDEHGLDDIRVTGVTTEETRTAGAVSTTINWEREN